MHTSDEAIRAGGQESRKEEAGENHRTCIHLHLPAMFI
jgi:hypothetical protein